MGYFTNLNWWTPAFWTINSIINIQHDRIRKFSPSSGFKSDRLRIQYRWAEKVLLFDSYCKLPWKCLMKKDPKWLPRNPAPVKVGGVSHCLQSFMHPRWLFGISSQIVGGVFATHLENMCKSSWIISPRDRGENTKSLKLSSRLWCSNCLQAYMLFLPDTKRHLQPFRFRPPPSKSKHEGYNPLKNWFHLRTIDFSGAGCNSQSNFSISPTPRLFLVSLDGAAPSVIWRMNDWGAPTISDSPVKNMWHFPRSLSLGCFQEICPNASRNPAYLP